MKAAKEKPADEDISADKKKIKVEKEDEEPMDGKNWETHDARKFIKNFHAAIPSKVCMVRFFCALRFFELKSPHLRILFLLSVVCRCAESKMGARKCATAVPRSTRRARCCFR
jgi:hypothetical protein